LNNRIAVFASGGGTNFQALIDEAGRGKPRAEIAGLICSRPDAGAILRAGKHGISCRVVSRYQFPDETAFGEKLLETLRLWDPALIVLAGYMSKIPFNVIEAYRGRIINIHPALLPKFGGKGLYGIRVHEAVIAAGEKESGCSVHIVTENYDEGPVIAQARVPVHPHDTPGLLADRILAEEHKLLPKVVAEMLEKINRNERI
jgi:phosphoribosylglycinamide formyltransferase 1